MWSPLYLAAEGSLVSRSGLIGFFQRLSGRTVEPRYLSSDDEQRAAPPAGGVFRGARSGRAPIGGTALAVEPGARLAGAGGDVGDPEFLAQAWDRDEFEVQAYWGEIERNTDLLIPDAYQTVLDDPLRHPNVVWRLAPLLSQAGYPTQALSLYEPMIDEYRRDGGRPAVGALARQCGSDTHGLGGSGAGAARHGRRSGHLRKAGRFRGHARSLHNQANVLHIQGEFDARRGDVPAARRRVAPARVRVSLALSLGNRANVLRERGDLDEALCSPGEGTDCRETGQHIELGNALDGQAAVLVTRGQPRQALELLEKEEALLREHGNRSFLPTCLGNQGIARLELGDGAGAMRLFRQQEELCRQLGDRKGLAEALGRLRPIKAASGDVSGAICRTMTRSRRSAASSA